MAFYKFIKTNKIFFILNLFFITIIFYLSIDTYFLLNNTLEKNGNWKVTKTTLEKYVLTASDYFKFTQALSENHLNLSSWFGYQEVISKNKFNLNRVEFDFLLSKDSYLYFLYNKQNSRSSLIRISNNPNFPPITSQIEESGEFILKKPLDIGTISDDRWHHIVISQTNENKLSIKIDKKNEIKIDDNFASEQYFGFRGSLNKVLIDNIAIKDKNNIIFTDNFKYHIDKFLIFFFISIIIVYLILLKLLSTVKFLPKKISKKNIIIFTIILIISTTINMYTRFVYTARYPGENTIISKIKNIFNHEVKNNVPWDRRFINEFYSKFVDSKKDKIVFIGSSQTWGSGARTEDETFVNIFTKNLIANNYNYQVINSGMCAIDSTELLSYYKEFWQKYKPKIMIINLSNNDKYKDIFKNNLEEFISINKKNNTKTVFVLEANSFENMPNSLDNHQVMLGIAKNEAIPVIDLHNYLKSKKDDGIIWWDFVHPTSFGHKLAGDFIFESIKNIL